MRDKTSEMEDIRTARRKIQRDLTCRFDNDPVEYPVYELSAHGFSFIIPMEFCIYKRGVKLDKISIYNMERLEIIRASGTVIHLSEYDINKNRVGILFDKKKLDRTISGRIRVFRHIPKVQLNVILKVKHNKKMHQLKGQVLDYTALTTRIKLHDIQTSIELKNEDVLSVVIFFEDHTFFKGNAHILQKRKNFREVIIGFPDKILDVESIDRTLSAVENSLEISNTCESLSNYDAIKDEFKALVNDWRMYLVRIKRILDMEDEKKLYQSPLEQEMFLKGIEKKVLSQLHEYVNRLNGIADHLDKSESEIYKEYFRENLDLYWRASPLGSAIINKPLGYSGDYEAIKMFFQNPYLGDSLFSKLINKFIMMLDAITAHQERIKFLYKQLNLSYKKAKNDFSILILGSGPAEELQQFVKKNRFKKPVFATLMDFDAFSLADFSDRMQYIQRKNFRFELINIDILGISRGKYNNPIKSKYQITYCSGLFDYFDQSICRRLIKYLIQHTVTGGTIIITNVHKRNTTRHFMDYGGRWKIIHRDENEIRALVPENYKTDFFYDTKKSNLFLKISIPKKTNGTNQ